MEINPVFRYFNGEKWQCSIGIVLAIVSISIALYFSFYAKNPFNKGFSYPFYIIPVLLLIICTGVLIRVPKDIERVNQYVSREKVKIETEEIPSMEKVLRNFKIIKRVELGLAVIGICLLLFAPAGSPLKGAGTGLVIQSLVLFAFDHLAEMRGNTYMEFLKSL